jgi:predicted porin
MHKKFIAIIIASAFTAPALAFAEATVYGQVNLSIDRVNDGMASSSSTNQLVSNGSRVGVNGSEDLGNGMSFVWVLEGSVEVDTGASNLFARAANAGLKSDSLGTVTLGLQVSPYKASARRLDVFGDTAADIRNHGMMGVGHDRDVKNAISYSSPSMGGFSVLAETVFGAESATGTAKKGSALGLAGMYEQGPIYTTLVYDSVQYGDVGTGTLGAVSPFAVDGESKVFMLGGSYAMDVFAVNLVVERTTDKLTATTTDSTGTNVYLAGKFNVSSTDAVKLAFTKRGATTDTANDARQYAIGYDHGLSKNTMTYALYTRVTDNTTGAADPSVASIGLKHAF